MLKSIGFTQSQINTAAKQPEQPANPQEEPAQKVVTVPAVNEPSS
jgi:hypothetical protein